MTKTLSLNKQQTSTMSFLTDELSKLATAVPKINSSEARRDPMANMRVKFAEAAAAQIALMKKGDEKGRWFFKEPSGRYVVTFRNGHVLMKLNGETHFATPNVEGAVKLLEAAREAALRKELDEVLGTHKLQRKPKAAKA